MIKISAIVCAHNPRIDIFERMLASLQNQQFNDNEWELIIIDNLSAPPLSQQVQITWKNAKFVIEKNLGLAHARVRGFTEATGELIICIDDDVFLTPNYFQNAWQIQQDYQFVGVWGTQLIPEFENKPTFPVEVYGNAERIVERDMWSNVPRDYATMPWGAGMCIRKKLAKQYVALVMSQPKRLELGRKGDQLFANEDLDLALFACDQGYAKGMFTSLKLTHFIPAKKMTKSYLEKNMMGLMYSSTLQNYVLDKQLPDFVPQHPINKILFYLRIFKLPQIRRKQEIAKIKGINKALDDMKKWGWI